MLPVFGGFAEWHRFRERERDRPTRILEREREKMERERGTYIETVFIELDILRPLYLKILVYRESRLILRERRERSSIVTASVSLYLDPYMY